MKVVQSNPILVFARQQQDQEAIRLVELVASSFGSVESQRIAFEECLAKAKLGSAFAMAATSQLLERGSGCERDPVSSLSWAQKAADMDHPLGHFRLGECLQFGIGTEVSSIDAVACFRRALAGGFGFAAYQLADLLVSTGEDHSDEIVNALQRGVLLGESFAALRLGRWYEHESKSGTDLAASWYSRASEMGLALASLRLADAYENGELGLPVDDRAAAGFRSLSERQMNLDS